MATPAVAKPRRSNNCTIKPPRECPISIGFPGNAVMMEAKWSIKDVRVFDAIGSLAGLVRSSSGEAFLLGHAGAKQLYPLLSKYAFHSAQQLLLIKVPVMKMTDFGEVLVMMSIWLLEKTKSNANTINHYQSMLPKLLLTLLPRNIAGAV